MARTARIIGIELPHHITQRGNYKQDIFSDDKDRNKYLSWIEEYSAKHSLSILAFCLMQNHVHFVAIPHAKDSLAKVFKSVHMRYSQYFNKKNGVSGHLWQGRFYSCILDEKHLVCTARYIERNPVRANMVEKPWEWKWSSALAHIDNSKKSLIKLGDIYTYTDIPLNSWKRFIDSKDDAKDLEKIRKQTFLGRPCGNNAFIKFLETSLGVKLTPSSVGRPKKKN